MFLPGLIIIATANDTAKDARNITIYSKTVLVPTRLRDIESEVLIMPPATAQTRTGMIISLIRLRYMSPMNFTSCENPGAINPIAIPAANPIAILINRFSFFRISSFIVLQFFRSLIICKRKK